MDKVGLREDFGLTPTEAAVAVEVLEAHGLQAAADRLPRWRPPEPISPTCSTRPVRAVRRNWSACFCEVHQRYAKIEWPAAISNHTIVIFTCHIDQHRRLWQSFDGDRFQPKSAILL